MTVGEQECAFCAIARGEDASAEILAEGAAWVAFFPLDPATPGHTLVIPRVHVADLWDIEPETAGSLMQGVIRVGQAIERTLRPQGMNLISSAGQAAEQTVFHLHLHVVPRWHRDGFGRIWPSDTTFSDEGLEELAGRIRSQLQPQPP